MNHFLTGFASELVKLGASRKNPYSQIQNQQDKLLRGNLSTYLGAEEVRHQAHPSMESVAKTKPLRESPKVEVRAPKIKLKPPKPPK